MGYRTIVVLDNDYVGEFKNSPEVWADLINNHLNCGRVGNGPVQGIKVIAVRHHTDKGFYYFNGSTLRAVDPSELAQCADCNEFVPRDATQAHRCRARG